MIKINNISFAYDDKKIFEDFSLEIGDNDRIWLSGGSGMGKTTLVRLILGLEKAQKGEIFIPKDAKPSVVFQEDRLLPFKTALQNVLLITENETLAKENLKALGLENEINTKISELSGGMARRVAIARALSVDFDYLILDEPFTGLDKENVILAVKQILKIAKDKSIILITHSPYEAELLSAKEIKLQT
ncbi:MAG: ABC transporter ATP-binding protein [Ruminococcaceae bacterium]|nr:ABC transporter ATP-binding protein [Oscillospiraceae bacterium]